MSEIGGAVESIGSSLTKVSLIVSAVVGFNTAVTGCVESAESRYRHFQTAVRDEEAFYKGLFGDYVTALDIKASDERRQARILTIKSLASRPLPNFSIFYLGPFAEGKDLKIAASRHIAAMQVSLLAAIENKDSSGAAVAAAAQIETFRADDASNLRARDGGNVVPVAQAQTANAVVATQLASATAAAGTLSYKARVLSAGSPTGYDIDVFWCAGDREADNAAVAQRAAVSLAAKADTLQPVGPGVRFGRVRLRPLPIALQTQGSYADRGYRIVYDLGPGDRAAASAVKSVLDASSPPAFTPGTSDKPSKWYVSVFVCPAASAHVPTTPAATPT